MSTLPYRPRRRKPLPTAPKSTRGKKHRLYISAAIWQRYLALQLYKPGLMPDPVTALESFMKQKCRRVERGLEKRGTPLPQAFREQAKKSRPSRSTLYKPDLLLKRVTESEPTGLAISGMIRETGWHYQTVKKYRDALVKDGRLRQEPNGMHHPMAPSEETSDTAPKGRRLSPKQIRERGFIQLDNNRSDFLIDGWQSRIVCSGCKERTLEIVRNHVECTKCPTVYPIRLID